MTMAKVLFAAVWASACTAPGVYRSLYHYHNSMFLYVDAFTFGANMVFGLLIAAVLAKAMEKMP